MISGSGDFGLLLAIIIQKIPPIIAKIAPTHAMKPEVTKSPIEKMIASIPPAIRFFHNATIAEIRIKVPRDMLATVYINISCMDKSMSGAYSGGIIGIICNIMK